VTKEADNIVIDLDKPDEELLKTIAEFLNNTENKVEKEGALSLNFLVRKKGEKDKKLVYNLTREELKESHIDFVFPKVVGEVLKKEFNPKIAKNEKLVKHLMKELREDPYWSNRIVKLVKSLKENNKKE